MMRKYWIVFDIETKEFINEKHLPIEEMTPSVIAWWDSRSKAVHTCTTESIGCFLDALQHASLVVGHNIVHFDLRVLKKYIPYRVPYDRTFDTMISIKKILGYRVALGNIAENTLYKKKSAHGGEAPVLYSEGRMEELYEYCRQDVLLTKKMFQYGCQNGKLYYYNKVTHQVEAIDTSGWDYESKFIWKHA